VNEFLLFVLPGAMYFWILFIGQAPMQEILQEKEERILPRILACPVTLGQYVGAKMLRCFVLCSLATVLLIVTSALLFGVQWGPVPKLAVVVVIWSGSMTGLIALIHSLARTREQANVISPLVLMVFAMLGGSMFPYENLPKLLQLVGQYTPNRWAVLTMMGVVRSKPTAELIVPVAALLALGVLGCLFAALLFQRQLSAGRAK
jgi:ABC-2 type transport system permease protein